MSRRRVPPTALLDAALLSCVPVAVCVLFLLPLPVRRELALYHLHPTATALYASHFVHFRLGHLTANLLGYALAVGVGYWLATLAGARHRYRVALVGLLVGLPIALSLVNLAWPRATLSYGSSGLVMGVAGLVPVFLFRYLERRTEAAVTLADAPLPLFVGLAVVGVVAPLGWLGIAVAVAATLTSVLYVLDVSATGLLAGLPAGHAELVLVATLVVVGYPLLAFPADPTVPGGTLNLLTHLLGYTLGFLPAYLTPSVGLDAAAVRGL